MKGQSIMLFCLGLAVGVGCGFGGSYLMQQMPQTNETTTISTTETNKSTETTEQVEKTDSANTELVRTTESTVSDDSPQNNTGVIEATTDASSNVLFSGYDWPEAEINGAIPEPNFGSKPTSVSLSASLVQTSYSGVSAENVLSYIEELKNLGYIYQSHESKTDSEYFYSAYNKEDVLSSSYISISYKNTQEFQLMWTRPRPPVVF